MEFSFGQNGELACGLYRRDVKRAILDIEECLIFFPDIPVILQAVKTFLKEKNYPAYDKFRHQGFLRHLIIRESKFAPAIMIGLVTTSSQTLDTAALVQLLQSLKVQSAIQSIYWILNDSHSDAVVFEKKELLFGEPTITEKLDTFTFNIGIDTFFQINPGMVTGFYKKITEYLNLTSEERVLDLFCGVGSIGMFLAHHAKYVWGGEVSREITDLAWQNARANS